MSADNSRPDALLPLRNLCNSVKSSRDRVRDRESNECSGAFSLSNFWEIMNEAVKSVSQEGTKLSVMFSKPPLPSEEGCVKIAESVQKSVLTLTTVYFWLPKSQGVTLRKVLRDATAQVLDGLAQLLEALLCSPGESLSQEQLMSTGGVWAACDQFNQLPKDNRSAVLSVLTSCVGLVKDASEEMEQVRDHLEQAYAVAHYKQTHSHFLRVIKTIPHQTSPPSQTFYISVSDDNEGCVCVVSVDDLALSLYPPVERSAVEMNVCKLACVLKKVLEITRSSHVCVEADVSWVEFLNSAVEHNLEKIRSLLLL
ncbi:cyclin-D1-binding protein 1 homolog [Sinocyclocheilus anshuiensis]|uniref:cyclin-D1-binding protein 1 homolog n=1 Tax=Sinocyclocheilus anshuiensis TaxID=1608454 RepID=UPI0007B8A076|nr:PREDICTED: cyclin-D1-binding protein 1 [Sinocyclocheilus anshuiensis]